MDPFTIVDVIFRVHDLIKSIKEIAELVRGFPDDARELAERTQTFESTLDEIERDKALHSYLCGHLTPFEAVLWEVREFLQRLAEKKTGGLKKFYGARSIKDNFIALHSKLDRCRSHITLGIVVALRKKQEQPEIPIPTSPQSGTRDSWYKGDVKNVARYFSRPRQGDVKSVAPYFSRRLNENEIAVGIDLGTTHSCVAVFRDGKVEAIPDIHGNRLMPSCVAFKDGEVLVGEAALCQPTSDSFNTIYDAKRLIGRNYSDPGVQQLVKHWPFQVAPGKDDVPQIIVKVNGEHRSLTAIDISSLILGELKKTAEAYTGKVVRAAVLTVPAAFNTEQRLSTVEAAEIAGMKVLRVISEPTAAASAYGLSFLNDKDERNCLVFDLGGGTFDATVLTLEYGILEVKATKGDTSLGGVDFDNRLLEWSILEVEKRFGYSISNNDPLLRRMRASCEHSKRTLSYSKQASIEIFLPNGINAVLEISWAQFEDLCMDLLSQIMDTVRAVLRDARISTSEIDDIVMVGAASRIPKLKQMLTELFEGKEPLTSVNAEEAVACGASIDAAVLTCSDRSGVLDERLLLDVLPCSLGIELEDGSMAVIIKKNVTLPARKTQTFMATSDGQSVLKVAVFEGEDPVA